MNRISAVIWDTGGVLIPDRSSELEELVAKFVGISLEEYKGKIDTNKKDLTTGRKTFLEIYKEVLCKWGKGKTASEAVAEHLRVYGILSGEIDSEIQKLIIELEEKGYKNIFCTNTEPEVWEFNKKRGLWKNYPDGGVASVEVGVGKPDLGIYKAALRLVGLLNQPEKAVFVDDKSDYIEAAQEIGIKTVYYPEYGRSEVLRKQFSELGIGL